MGFLSLRHTPQAKARDPRIVEQLIIYGDPRFFGGTRAVLSGHSAELEGSFTVENGAKYSSKKAQI